MKKATGIIILLLSFFRGESQQIIVNKFRHTPLLLNIYASAMNDDVNNVVSAAYSLRRINLFYTGPLVRIINISTSVQYDIGYNSSTNDLDTVYLKSVLGSSSGYIVKWYDQTGNGRHVFPSSNTITYMPRIAASGVIDRKGTKNVPAVTFQLNTNELYYTTATSTNAQVITAVRDLVGDSYQYLFSMPADADFSVRAAGAYTAASAGGYSDGPNVNDWWFSGTMYVNGTAISGMTSGAVKALHTLCSIASSAQTGTFSISNTSGSAWSNRGMYNNDGVCELIVFPSSSGMAANRATIQNNQKAYFGTP